MAASGQRFLLRCLLIFGILLCLTPGFANLWLVWQLSIQPLLASEGKNYKPPDSAQLQMAMQHNPVFLVTMFVLAPAGVILIVFSAIRLRRLRQQPPPPLPDNYGVGRGGQ